MKVEVFKEMLGTELSAFFEIESNKKNLKAFKERLFGIPEQSRRDKMVLLFAERLVSYLPKKEKEEKKFGVLRAKFTSAFQKAQSLLSQDSVRRIQALLSSEPTGAITRESGSVSKSEPVVVKAQEVSFDRFPHDSVSLKELPSLVRRFEKTPGDVKALHDEIHRRTEVDPELVRVEKTNDVLSIIRLPEQNFIISALPATLAKVQDYWRKVLELNSSLLISVHHIQDEPERCHGFWHQPILSQLQVDGWNLQEQKSETVLEGKVPNAQGEVPKIVSTTLTATKEGQPQRTITHLHYEGWLNHSQASDEVLVNQLFDLAERLSPDKERPIAINCCGGAGRSCTVATSYLMRRQIKAALAQGCSLENISINVPETMYALKKQRKGLHCNALALPQVYSVTLKFVEGIQTKRTIA